MAIPLDLPDLKDAPITDEALTILGLMIAEGSFGPGVSTWSFTKSDVHVRNELKRCLRAIGMSEDAPRKGGRRFSEARYANRTPLIRIATGTGSPAVALFNALGVAPARAAEKRVPAACFGLSRRQVGRLIGALWSGDDAIYINHKKRAFGKITHQVSIVYGSRSLQLSHDVQSLLLRLGILSSVVSSSVAYKGERRAYHYTTVVGRESKRAFLIAAQTGTIPISQSAERLEKLIAALDAREAKHGRGDRETDGVDENIENGIFWDHVESVLFSGAELCYDIEVPGLSTFVSGDVITHNTAARLYGQASLQRYTLKLQFIGYRVLGPLLFGSQFGGVLINALEVDNPEGPKFLRTSIDPAPEAMKRFPQVVHDTMQEMARLEEAQVPAQSYRPAWSETVCVTPYGLCRYHSACRLGILEQKPDTRRLNLEIDFSVGGPSKPVTPLPLAR